MGVIDIAQARSAREDHISGAAKCLACHHRWIAVSPVGTIWLECPECTLDRGRYIAECIRENRLHWSCGCENDLFYLTSEGIYCPNCGEWQQGF